MLVFKDFLSFIILQRLRCLKKWHLYFLFFESRKFLHFLEFLQNFLNKLSFAGSLSTCHKGQMLSIYSSILLFRVKEFDHILGKAWITDAWEFDLFLVLKFAKISHKLKLFLLKLCSKLRNGHFLFQGLYISFDSGSHDIIKIKNNMLLF